MRHTLSAAKVFLLALIAANCDQNPPPAQPGVSRADSPAPAELATPVVAIQADESQPSEPFTCTPDTLRPGDTLTFRMRTPHGDYLIVRHPDRTVYFIVYPQLGNPTRKYSLIPSESFKQIRTVRLAADVRATPRVYGRDTILEPVFNAPGKYLIHMGENLESDFNDKSFSCTVTVVGSPKPVSYQQP